MKRINYLRKYFASGANKPASGEAAFLRFMESLNEADWVELLTDAINQSPPAMLVFRPDRGEELLACAGAYLKRLGLTTLRLIGSALRRISTSAISEDNLHSLSSVLFFAAILPSEESRSLLMAIVDSDASDQIRAKAMAALANQSEYLPLTYWKAVNLDRNPTFMPAVAYALSTADPAEMLRVLAQAKSPPEDETSLEYPLRLALRVLVRTKSGWRTIRNSLLESEPWLTDRVDAVMQFEEFDSFRRSWQTTLQDLRRHRTATKSSLAAVIGDTPAQPRAKDVAELLGTIALSASQLYEVKDPHLDKVANNIVRHVQEAGHVLHQMQHGPDTSYKRNLTGIEDHVSVSVPNTLSAGRESILVVDDNADLRKFVVLYLTQAGYRVLQETTLDGAILALNEGQAKIDLIVTDIELPDAENRLHNHGGLSVAEAARAHVSAPKVVFITGGAVDDRIKQAAADYGPLLVKPFEVKTLLDTIGSLIRPPSETEARHEG
jgi:CheY-like chemotaxis protein